MKALGCAIVVAVVVSVCVYASAAAAHPARTDAGVACGQRVTVIGVRGSGDPQSGDLATDKYGDSVHGMGKPGAAFAVALANRLPQRAVTFLPLIYPAVGLLDNSGVVVFAFRPNCTLSPGTKVDDFYQAGRVP